MRDTAGGCVPGRQVILLLLENMDFVSTCILKLFYMLPSLLILALFIVDPDAIIAKGDDLLSLEEIRQSIVHIKVLVVRVSEL